MSLVPDIRTYLLSKASITTLVGTRIYKLKMPQENKTFPVIILTQISGVPAHSLAGIVGYEEARVQVDCYASGADSTKSDSVDAAVFNVLAGFPVTLSSTANMGASIVSSVVAGSPRDLYEPPVDASDVGLFRKSRDYWVRHDVTVPNFT